MSTTTEFDVNPPTAEEVDDLVAADGAEALRTYLAGETGPSPDDPTAPYGRKADGTPKRSNGGRPSKRTARTRTTRPPAAAAAPRPRTDVPKVARPKPAAKLTVADKIVGGLQIVLPIMAEANPVDAAIVGAFGATIAQQWEAAAAENEAVRRFFDGVQGKAGLPSAIITTAAMLGCVALNHGVFDRFAWGRQARERIIPRFAGSMAEAA